MSTQVAASVSLPAPDAPDRDFDGLLARALTAIQYTQGTVGAWTDHNTHDPGITLLEAALWALADLHYRTATRSFGGWNADVRDWRGPGLPGADLERKLLLARAALDHADAVETAAAASADDAIVRSAVGAALGDEGLVDAEVVALVARERRRLLARLLADRPDEIREVVARSSAGNVINDLRASFKLNTADAPLALAVEPAPPADPELWEDAYGRTTLWPPHPIQTRSCDPVTTDDYLRLATAQDPVRRAWIVPGLAVGVRYDGSLQMVELPLRRGALTLLVEPYGTDATYRNTATGALTTAGVALLTNVLEGVTGVAPASEPGISYRNKNIAPADGVPTGPPWRSRRLLGDELGAALICRRDIVVGGTLEIAPTADQAGVLLRADAALSGFLSAEKTGLDDPPPPPPQPVFPEAIDGPWPNAAHARAAMSGAPATGWAPGEPVRVSEVVELLQAVDGVIGVDGLTIAFAAATPIWHHDLLPIGKYCIPAYAHHCLCIRIVDARRCDG